MLAGVRRALKPAGRFVGDMGGAGNIAREVAALSAALNRRGYDPETRQSMVFPDCRGVSEPPRGEWLYG